MLYRYGYDYDRDHDPMPCTYCGKTGAWVSNDGVMLYGGCRGCGHVLCVCLTCFQKEYIEFCADCRTQAGQALFGLAQ